MLMRRWKGGKGCLKQKRAGGTSVKFREAVPQFTGGLLCGN
jgi:hypothetical protein